MLCGGKCETRKTSSKLNHRHLPKLIRNSPPNYSHLAILTRATSLDKQTNYIPATLGNKSIPIFTGLIPTTHPSLAKTTSSERVALIYEPQEVNQNLLATDIGIVSTLGNPLPLQARGELGLGGEPCSDCYHFCISRPCDVAQRGERCKGLKASVSNCTST